MQSEGKSGKSGKTKTKAERNGNRLNIIKVNILLKKDKKGAKIKTCWNFTS